MLEVCCYTIESAIKAAKAGAQRIELCDNYLEGGTTPSFACIKKVLEIVKIPVHVIVRPRGGDFLYTNLEYETIKEDINQIKKLGANGIVVGFLLQNGEIDLAKTKEVVQLSNPMSVTFHRAFDMCKNPLKALEQLKETGISRVLTSGGKKSAFEGIDLISQLVNNADNNITIMPGGGINADNLSEIIERTHVKEVHSSAKIFTKSQMSFMNNQLLMGDNKNYNEFAKIDVNAEMIKSMVQILTTKLA